VPTTELAAGQPDPLMLHLQSATLETPTALGDLLVDINRFAKR
jgi:hypothetical protein